MSTGKPWHVEHEDKWLRAMGLVAGIDAALDVNVQQDGQLDYVTWLQAAHELKTLAMEAMRYEAHRMKEFAAAVADLGQMTSVTPEDIIAKAVQRNASLPTATITRGSLRGTQGRFLGLDADNRGMILVDGEVLSFDRLSYFLGEGQ